MTIINQISTHKAVRTETGINIILKGFNDDTFKEDSNEDEILYTLPLEGEDDVFAIMERYASNNRYNLAEANGSF